MAHGYRTLQNWDDWLAQQFLGQALLQEEADVLSRLLKNHYGKHALLIGVPHQAPLLSKIDIPNISLMSPPIQKEHQSIQIESDFHELPIQSGSIDLVVIPHTLEFVDHPRHLFSEACRIVKPEGLIVIHGFNPHSLWGLRSPFSANTIAMKKIKGWLKLEDFVIEEERAMLFCPPINHPNLFRKLHFLENLGKLCFASLGGAYLLIARAKVIPLTPIRMKWKQQLSSIHLPSSISGHIARQSK